MSVFASDLLEEIVETTEEQEADLCSSGETVDECTGLPLGSEFIEEPEHKHQPHLVSSSPTTPPPTTTNTTSSNSGSGTRQQKSGNSRSSSSQNLTLNGNANPGRGASSRNHMEQEKRMRREIANSNERRRMQSINAGFQSLRTLLPHHEGEKLSKAAILQQTAEYIYQLEQQKTQLLSQNLQLKRLVDQHEGGDVPTKKRKHESQGVVVSLPVHVSESGDEGLGSMSPEPLSVITVSADGHASVGSNNNNNNNGSDSQVAELKRQLERERNARAHLEKQMRTLQSQLFPNDRYREEQIIAYQPHEVIEHTNNVLQQDLEDGMPGLQVVSVVSVPTVGSTQTVETSNADSNTPPLSPQPTSCEIIVPSSLSADDVAVLPPKDPRLEVTVNDILQQVESRPTSPSPQSQPQSQQQVTKIVAFAGVAGTVFASTIDEQTVAQSAGSFSPAYAATLTPTTVTGKFEATAAGQFITASPTRPFSPEQDGSQQRLPSVLEAAMKAEPKVEVERLPSPSNSLDDVTSAPQARLYVNTSRQNLETIVEAIRHLEGDHLFSDEQDVPLALTNKSNGCQTVAVNANASSPNTKRLHAEVNSFLQFNSSSSSNNNVPVTTQSTTQQSSAQQVRPGVIVAKHS